MIDLLLFASCCCNERVCFINVLFIYNDGLVEAFLTFQVY